MQYGLLCISQLPLIKILDKTDSPLPFLSLDNLTLFVGIQVERYPDKQADKFLCTVSCLQSEQQGWEGRVLPQAVKKLDVSLEGTW